MGGVGGDERGRRCGEGRRYVRSSDWSRKLSPKSPRRTVEDVEGLLGRVRGGGGPAGTVGGVSWSLKRLGGVWSLWTRVVRSLRRLGCPRTGLVPGLSQGGSGGGVVCSSSPSLSCVVPLPDGRGARTLTDWSTDGHTMILRVTGIDGRGSGEGSVQSSVRLSLPRSDGRDGRDSSLSGVPELLTGGPGAPFYRLIRRTDEPWSSPWTTTLTSYGVSSGVS